MGGKTSAASKNKYIAKAYDRVNLILRKDAPQNKAAVQAAADAAGESLKRLHCGRSGAAYGQRAAHRGRGCSAARG